MSDVAVQRRSGARIMARLIVLLGSLAYVMVLAVANGALGFICAMGVTLMGRCRCGEGLGRKHRPFLRRHHCFGGRLWLYAWNIALY